ncbi:MAG TPA: hypothetical protein VNI83_06715 [Vicinamibacterales bacterium]|nr:hypothetical protein [Vicinamibacterales bacterium]
MGVRLFVGNLPYSTTEAELRQYFSAVAPPTAVAVPVDRETGRPRGFAFVEFADATAAQEAIRRFNGQPFQGRPLSVSEARAREDRGPRPAGAGPARSAGPYVPRPPRPPLAGPAPAPPPRGDRPARTFGPDAKPKRGSKYSQRTERPKGPIPEKHTGRVYSVDAWGEEDDAAEPLDFDDFASSLPPDRRDQDGDDET